MSSAHYFDGASARLHPVRLALDSGAIMLAGPDIEITYRFAQTRLAEPFAGAPWVLDFADGARCELTDGAGKAALADALGYRPSWVQRWQRRWYGALLALLLLIALGVAGVRWGIPALAERVVAALPAAADQRVGDRTMEALEGSLFEPSRLSDQRIAEVDAIFDAISPPRTRIPIRLRVVNMPKQPPNAFALPNGTIVLTDAMVLQILDGANDFDPSLRAQLAGVLAHEIGHIEGRHGMRAMVRSSLTVMTSAALLGDFSAVAAGTPALLLNMDYSRRMESEADGYAILRMREQGMSPAELADLFDVLGRKNPSLHELPAWLRPLGYLSSHPPSAERSARLRAAAAPRQHTGAPASANDLHKAMSASDIGLPAALPAPRWYGRTSTSAPLAYWPSGVPAPRTCFGVSAKRALACCTAGGERTPPFRTSGR
jgi:Zn-dependent protease with chaperone function